MTPTARTKRQTANSPFVLGPSNGQSRHSALHVPCGHEAHRSHCSRLQHPMSAIIANFGEA